jgi:hypothetical protein
MQTIDSLYIFIGKLKPSITRKYVFSNFCLFTNKLVKTAQQIISGVRKKNTGGAYGC